MKFHPYNEGRKLMQKKEYGTIYIWLKDTFNLTLVLKTYMINFRQR